MSTRRTIVSAVSACLLSACSEGGATADSPELLTVAAADPGPSGPAGLLDLDLAEAQQEALARLPRVDLVAPDARGVPRFLVGDLGVLSAGEAREAARAYLAEIAPVFRLGADADLEPVRSRTDALGQVHVRFQQYLHDLPVVGGELTVHADAATGAVHAVTGEVAPAGEFARVPTIDGEPAIARLAAALSPDAVSLDAPELVYVVTEAGVRLAWQAAVAYEDDEGPQRDLVFADARTGELVARHPQIHRARSRKVYTSGGTTKLPGKLVMKEGESAEDPVAQAAYDLAGDTHEFYAATFGRDSFDAEGATIYSTVHFHKDYVNAFWNGQQMVYGDGDGEYAGPLAQDMDVVVHELTHAVTQYEARLVYQNESGALNEAFSDIMAAAADAWKHGVSDKTWMLAESCWTPGQDGDAMRYMADPTADGQSYDYYPERYTGHGDNGGVHLNSGIANLAFYLLSQGGTHPRGKTDTEVPALGVDKATRIFYRALTTYLGQNATFLDARNATAQAAAELFDAEAATAVHAAWTAVGVPTVAEDGGEGGEVCAGTPVDGELPGSGAAQYQPAGSYYFSSGGTHTGCLVGAGEADFDLYLHKWDGSAWTPVATSVGATSRESIRYDGAAGYYTWLVVSRSGEGHYSLTLQTP